MVEWAIVLVQTTKRTASQQRRFPPLQDAGEDMQSEYAQVKLGNCRFESVLPLSLTNNHSKLVRITAYVLKFFRIRMYNHLYQRSQAKIASASPTVAAVSNSGTVQPPDVSVAEVQLIFANYCEGEEELHRLNIANFNAHCA